MSDRSTATFDDEIAAAFSDVSEDQPTSETAPETPAQPDAPVAAQPSTDVPVVVPPTDQSATTAAPPPVADPSIPASPAAPAVDAGTAYQFRADGRDLAIPGAVRLADGSVRIPSESVPHLQRHLADRTAIGERERQYRSQIHQLTQSRSAAEVKAQHMLASIGRLATMTNEERADWVIGFINELPILQAKAENAALQAQLDERTRTLQPYQQQEQAQVERPQIQAALERFAADMAQQPALAGLDLQAAMATVNGWIDHLVTKAPADDPGRGLQAGATAINLDLLSKLLEQEHRNQTAARQARETAAAQAKAASANAAALAPAAPARPSAQAVAPVRPKAQQPRDANGQFRKDNQDISDRWAEFDPLGDKEF